MTENERIQAIEEEQRRNSRAVAQFESIAPRIETAVQRLEDGVRESVTRAAQMEIAAARRNGRVDALEANQRRIETQFKEVLDALESLPCSVHAKTLEALECEQEEQRSLWNILRDKAIEIIMILITAVVTFLLSGGWQSVTK